MKRFLLIGFLLFSTIIFAKTTINKSIHVSDGTIETESYTSVNGSIKIGQDCKIRGNCSTVNGSVVVGQKSRAKSLSTVNGSIKIANDCEISGEAKSVNGGISMDAGSSINRDITTVNGSIKLVGTHAQDDIETVNGSIRLMDGTVVEGNIFIKDAKNNKKKNLEIHIIDSVVEGDIINRNDNMRVHVYLKSGGKVLGELRNVELED